MNKYQALAALILEEVRTAELASLNQDDPKEAEALVLERLEAVLREHLSEVKPPPATPYDSLSVSDPGADLDLGDRWNWKPQA